MQGALLSISGGHYRSNTITPESGVLSFKNLVSSLNIISDDRREASGTAASFSFSKGEREGARSVGP